MFFLSARFIFRCYSCGLRNTVKSSQQLSCIVRKDNMYLPKANFVTNGGDDSPKFMVSIEGNIGCGKSTLLNYFKKFGVVEIIQEPIDQWTDVDGHNVLESLYQDGQRWNFTFNMYALLTRMKLHTMPQIKPVRLMERSVYSTHHCFVENNFQSGTLTGLEHGILSQWFDWLVSAHDTHLNLIVYLKADPYICYERLKKRARKEEESVPLTLLENLHKMHEDWLVKQVHGPLPAPVMVLDANSDMEEILQVYETKKHHILCDAI